MSLRARHVLGLADAVACEDTRNTGQLLHRLGLSRPLLAAHEHNEREAAARIVERLARGERIAYVSDAGTPGVSDPGARIVEAVRAAGQRVIPLPGASAVVTALSAAGELLETSAGQFTFVGFLPPKAGQRDTAIRQWAAHGPAWVLYEAPHRIDATLAALAAHLPARRLLIGRELTKLFEQIVVLPAAEAPAWLAADASHGKGSLYWWWKARARRRRRPPRWPRTRCCVCCWPSCRPSARPSWPGRSPARRSTRCTRARWR